ncbi:MAG: WXG100 family type VII secretion target [Chloroflexi bacterium]|nr:MAG: WXG100 family type VII secretion target [Chloroflexota bacterium]TME56234.1 MAG: WXG100 family type VII secretion target [Chloroflexota bacterium]
MSQDGHILVTFGAINEAAMDTDSVASQIAQQLSDLKAYLAPLVASWSGDASSEYQALQSRWDASANDLNQVLRQMAQALRTAGDNYSSTERKNSSIWT